MHEPPPPIPIHNPAGVYSEVREVSPDEMPAREPSEIFRRAVETLAKQQELEVELVKDKYEQDDLRAELRAETARSNQEANRTVLDERDERRRSRTERGR
jgi:hypothetical protein